MSRPGPETMAKRQREREKAEKRRAKQEKIALRKAQKKGLIEQPTAETDIDSELPQEADDVDPIGSPDRDR